MSFRFDQPLYHGTRALEDFLAFSLTREGAATERPTVGVWAAKDPEYSNQLLDILGQQGPGQSGNPRVLPLYARSEKSANLPLTGDEAHHEVVATIGHVFKTTPIDAVQITGKSDQAGTWVFKNPNQLRSRFAQFDPAKRGSSNLLAGVAGAAGAGSLAAAMAAGSQQYSPWER